MKPPKPFEVIAARFQVSNESAKYFLTRVQKCFRTERPPHALISTFMGELDLQHLPVPYDLARMMHEDGVWAHPMNAQPERLQDEEDAYLE